MMYDSVIVINFIYFTTLIAVIVITMTIFIFHSYGKVYKITIDVFAIRLTSSTAVAERRLGAVVIEYHALVYSIALVDVWCNT